LNFNAFIDRECSAIEAADADRTPIYQFVGGTGVSEIFTDRVVLLTSSNIKELTLGHFL